MPARRQRQLAVTWKPPPGGRRRASSPPSSATRSCMPASPCPPSCADCSVPASVVDHVDLDRRGARGDGHSARAAPACEPRLSAPPARCGRRTVRSLRAATAVAVDHERQPASRHRGRAPPAPPDRRRPAAGSSSASRRRRAGRRAGGASRSVPAVHLCSIFSSAAVAGPPCARAPAACRTTTLRLCATMSCSSRAIRARSAATASWACCCSAAARRRARTTMPISQQARISPVKNRPRRVPGPGPGPVDGQDPAAHLVAGQDVDHRGGGHDRQPGQGAVQAGVGRQ